MIAQGGCYCGDVRYSIDGEPRIRALCFCSVCQKVSGGGAATIMGVPETAFAYTAAPPANFAHPGVEDPVTRDFCANCGTQLVSHTPRAPGMVMVKAGTLDDPAVFGMPQAAVYMAESHAFHAVPDRVRKFDTTTTA